MLGPMAGGRKRPEGTVRRAQERDARKRVRDREKLAALSPGGARCAATARTAASIRCLESARVFTAETIW